MTKLIRITDASEGVSVLSFYFLSFSLPFSLFSYVQSFWGTRQGCEDKERWDGDLLTVFL